MLDFIIGLIGVVFIFLVFSGLLVDWLFPYTKY